MAVFEAKSMFFEMNQAGAVAKVRMEGIIGASKSMSRSKEEAEGYLETTIVVEPDDMGRNSWATISGDSVSFVIYRPAHVFASLVSTFEKTAAAGLSVIRLEIDTRKAFPKVGKPVWEDGTDPVESVVFGFGVRL